MEWYEYYPTQRVDVRSQYDCRFLDPRYANVSQLYELPLHYAQHFQRQNINMPCPPDYKSSCLDKCVFNTKRTSSFYTKEKHHLIPTRRFGADTTLSAHNR